MTSPRRCEDSPAAGVLHGRMKGPVVASLAFFAVAIGLAGFVAVATEVTGENPISSTEVGDRSRVHQLDTGDCFDVGPTYDASQDVTVLDCEEPHDSEVVWTDNFSTYGSDGDEAAREAVDEAEGVCRERFEAYVDALPADSGVELRPYLDGGIDRMRDLGTDETRWQVACVAWSADGRFGG